MDPNEITVDHSRAESETEDKPKAKRLPPIVLPIFEFNQPNENSKRLMSFIGSCHRHKWEKTNINPKTKKYLARSGFHQFFWSAILIDSSILDELKIILGENIIRISDEQFEATFGIPLDPCAEVNSRQLVLNCYLFFTVWAKSDTNLSHGQDWPRKRIEALYRTHGIYDHEPIDSHPELFIETRRRFRAYKDLIPALTRYVIKRSDGQIDNKNGDNDRFVNSLFVQIKLLLSHSGLQVFKLSWLYYQSSKPIESDSPYHYKAFELEAVKEDVNRLKANRQIIIDKYGEDMLPFARLLAYPEAEGLDQRHYPDLAFCARHNCTKEKRPNEFVKNISFRKIPTKTHISDLKRLAEAKNDNYFSFLFHEESADSDLLIELQKILSLLDKH